MEAVRRTANLVNVSAFFIVIKVGKYYLSIQKHVARKLYFAIHSKLVSIMNIIKREFMIHGFYNKRSVYVDAIILRTTSRILNVACQPN
jgi:hypothetical protein